MSGSIFPLAFAAEEIRLLTAIVLGFLFGFALERGGFGNARKLAAQFYFTDMTVFKVMFTAILVAMVGLYTLAGLGLVDLSLMWINPTFVWAQVVGGFLLGVGFIMSGLCPGTSVVSAASGRWDAWVTFAGIFLGTLLWTVAVAAIPALETLYTAGSMGVSVLPELLAVPPLLFVLGVVVVAGLGFLGAEKVEAVMARTHEPVELTPPNRPRMKVALAGGLGAIAVVGLVAASPPAERSASPMEGIAPLELAERIVEGDPMLFLVDLRDGEVADRIPGAYAASTSEDVAALLEGAPAGARVVVYDATGALKAAPPGWPVRLAYGYLEGGWKGWEFGVLTPAPSPDLGYATPEEARWTARQQQLSAFFTGAVVESSASAPAPLPMPAGGAKKKKRAGGC